MLPPNTLTVKKAKGEGVPSKKATAEYSHRPRKPKAKGSIIEKRVVLIDLQKLAAFISLTFKLKQVILLSIGIGQFEFSSLLKSPEISDAMRHLSAAEFHSVLHNVGISSSLLHDVKTSDPEIRQYSDLPSWIGNNTEQLRGNNILIHISAALVSVAKEHGSYGEIIESKAGQGALLLNILSKYGLGLELVSLCLYLYHPEWYHDANLTTMNYALPVSTILVEEFQTYLFVFMHARNQWKVYEVAKRRNTIAALEAGALKTMTQMMIKETRKSLQSGNDVKC
ncbi:Rhodanese-like domain-containing protein 6 [Sesamum angolense]|uniref:Rhodanese-like domain-containing protein 6 n=1 Tax=Sesamum angolense TaxID=2727404 RepID=A0AAE1T341_9LAMI|nr:Rhodanese-like domain-containing protein 6 [Sesamum angolense]